MVEFHAGKKRFDAKADAIPVVLRESANNALIGIYRYQWWLKMDRKKSVAPAETGTTRY